MDCGHFVIVDVVIHITWRSPTVPPTNMPKQTHILSCGPRHNAAFCLLAEKCMRMYLPQCSSGSM